MTRTSIALAVCIVGVATLRAADQAPATTAVDWPQWRGTQRNGISTESGLLQQWPATGPGRVWEAAGVGAGYGAVSVAGPHVYVQGSRGRQSLVFAVDRAKGATVWSRALGQAGDNDRGPGPRSTPTVDGDRLYALTESGDLACLRVADGSVVWAKNILREFRGQNPNWLLSESPLVDGDRVIVTPGGPQAGMVALNKLTGQTVWTARDLSDEPGYVSAVAADFSGVHTILTMTSANAVGVRASDGKLMWRYRPVANNTANATTPVVQGNQVFFTSNYGTGGALLTMMAKADEVRAQETYFTQDMRNHHGGVVLVDGVLYGFDDAILAALDFATGKRLWRHRSVGKGAVAYADRRLYIVGENNVVGLAQVTPAGYREVGNFTIADKGWPTWAHPVISGGRLYIRNQDTITAYDVRAK
jgi:outer membrane protein assembly factor BamB